MVKIILRMKAEETDVVFDRKAMLVRALDGIEDERPTKRKKLNFKCQYCDRVFNSYDENQYKSHELHHAEWLHNETPGPCDGLPDMWIQTKEEEVNIPPVL